MKNTKLAVNVEEVEVEEVVIPQEPASDYLMWVGAVHYPTVDDYIDEALSQGFCKRVGKLPHRLVPGESRVFLAHDDGVTEEGFIFGYFIPSEVQFLCKNEDQVPENIYERVVPVTKWLDEEERGCGTRREGLYVVNLDLDSEVEGSFVIFDKPRKLEAFDPDRKHFRGMLEIGYGDNLVGKNGKVSKKLTMVPPSRNAAEPVDPKTPWTPEEDKQVLESLFGAQSIYREAQILSYKTGRNKMSIIYRWQSLTKEVNEEEETE